MKRQRKINVQMYDRIEWDYKIKLKRYLKKQNFEKTQFDFLLIEIERLKNEISDLKGITDQQINNEIIKDLPRNYEIAKRENEENNFLNSTRKDRRKEYENKIKDYQNILVEYQIKLDALPLPKSQKEELKEKSLPYKIALLDKIGFFNLPSIKNLTKANQRKVVIKLIEGTDRQIKGNINVLNYKSLDDRIRYTSFSYEEEVSKFLQEISN